MYSFIFMFRYIFPIVDIFSYIVEYLTFKKLEYAIRKKKNNVR